MGIGVIETTAAVVDMITAAIDADGFDAVDIATQGGEAEIQIGSSHIQCVVATPVIDDLETKIGKLHYLCTHAQNFPSK